MKLNPDCIRDILITIEEVTDFWTAFEYPNSEYERLNSYSKTEVLSHVEQCNLQNLIIGYEFFMSQSISIKELSPKGHDFLSAIRSDTAWKKIKGEINNLKAITLTKLIGITIDSLA